MKQKTKETWYPAIARSSPYMCPYSDRYVVQADIVQKTQITAKRIYVEDQVDIDIGDTITCKWDYQICMYKLIQTMNQHIHTDKSNSYGGFYYIDGTQA